MKRVQTGALKINDDWTGIFIRGDNALLYYYPAILKIIEGQTLNAFDRAALKNLESLLKSCREGSVTQTITGEVQ